VVIAAGEMISGSDTARLDGVTVTGGNATGTSDITVNEKSVSRLYGGGVFIRDASPVFVCDSIAGNQANGGGGGMYIAGTSATVIKDLIIYGNSMASTNGFGGGGMYIAADALSITRTAVSGNTSALSGGGMYIGSGSPEFTGVVISGNKATEGGGVYVGSGSPRFTNTLISGNVATTACGGVYNKGASVFINVTVAGNFASSGYGGVYNDKNVTATADAEFYNTIAWNNTPATADISKSPSPGKWKNNWMDGKTTNSLVDAMFIDPKPATGINDMRTDGDYRLRKNSPAIDAGDSTLLNPRDTDLAGKDRVRSCNIDMGAYEYQDDDLAINPASGIVYVTENGSGDMDGSSWDDAYPGLAYPLLMAGRTDCYSIKEIRVAAGTYWPRYYAGNGTTDRDRAFVMVPGVKIYGGFSGSESELSGRDSTVNRHGIVQMSNKTVLSGDLGRDDIPGNTASYKSDNVYHVVIAAGNMINSSDTARLDGVTVTGGNANYTNSSYSIKVNEENVNLNNGGGIFVANASPIFVCDSIAGNQANVGGGGIYISGTASAPAIKNLIIYGNSIVLPYIVSDKGDGGGMYISAGAPSVTRTAVSGNTAEKNGGGVYIQNGSPEFTGVVISGNKATEGGGVYVDISTVTPISRFTNTLISGNVATNSYGGGGGGVYNKGAFVFTNVTVAGNYAPSLGGVNNGNTTAANATKFYNTIIWNNTPAGTAGIGTLGNILHSLIEGVDLTGTGTGNFDGTQTTNDPDFLDPDPATSTSTPKLGGDYSLKPESLVKDSGDNSLNSTPKDLAGNLRIQNSVIDLGAYEITVQNTLTAVDDYISVLMNSMDNRIIVGTNDVMNCEVKDAEVKITEYDNNDGHSLTMLNDSVMAYTPAAGIGGMIDSATYEITCDDVTSSAKVYIMINRPRSKRYIACPNAPATVGFINNDPDDIKYYWYYDNGNQIKPTASDTVTTYNVQILWAEPHYKNMVFPRVKVEIELGSDCQISTPTDCAANGTVIWKENFGGNSVNDPPGSNVEINHIISSDYTFCPYNDINRGDCISQTNLSYYTVDKDGFGSDPSWHQNNDDHTHPDDTHRGYMLMANGNSTESELLYSQQITNLCANMELYFSAWLANICKTQGPDKPRLRLEIMDVSNNILAKYYTGELPQTDGDTGLQWLQYGFRFNNGEHSTLHIQIHNEGSPNKDGNAFVVDDIELRFCAPPIEMNIPGNDTVVCASSTPLEIVANYTDASCTLGADISYRWEFRHIDSVNWKHLSTGDRTCGLGVHESLVLSPVSEAVRGYYRMVIGSTGNIDKTCRVVSDSIFVDIAKTLRLPDVRIDICRLPLREIRLSAFIDSIGTVEWTKTGAAPNIALHTGAILTDEINEKARTTYKYLYSQTSQCGTSSAIAYVHVLGNRMLRKIDTVAICGSQELSKHVNLNQILGTELGGTWKYDPPVNPDNTVQSNVTEFSSTSNHYGAQVFNAAQAYIDAPDYGYKFNYRGDTEAKKFKFEYTPDSQSCVSETKTLVIVVTKPKPL
jgi:hypothetical protein